MDTKKPNARPGRAGMARAGVVWLVAWLAVGSAFAARAVTAPPTAAGEAARTGAFRAKPIERVRAGDRVWACDPATGRWAVQAVVQPLTHAYDGDVVTICAAGEAIEATGNHPFWVVAGEGLQDRPDAPDVPAAERAVLAETSQCPPGGRWVEARGLLVGDRLLLRDGRTASVERLASRIAALPVYNLEVAGLHTYAVSRAGVLVHNKVGPDGPGGTGWGSSPKDPIYRGVPGPHVERGADALKGVAKPRGDRLDSKAIALHVADGDVRSGVTSWTTDREQAKRFSGSEGTILETSRSSLVGREVPRPDVGGRYKDEKEILIRGVVTGVTPTKP